MHFCSRILAAARPKLEAAAAVVLFAVLSVAVFAFGPSRECPLEPVGYALTAPYALRRTESHGQINYMGGGAEKACGAYLAPLDVDANAEGDELVASLLQRLHATRGPSASVVVRSAGLEGREAVGTAHIDGKDVVVRGRVFVIAGHLLELVGLTDEADDPDVAAFFDSLRPVARR